MPGLELELQSLLQQASMHFGEFGILPGCQERERETFCLTQPSAMAAFTATSVAEAELYKRGLINLPRSRNIL